MAKSSGSFKKGDPRINNKGRIDGGKKKQIHAAFDEHRDSLIKKCLALAEAGDPAMVKLSLSYCSPPIQHRTVKIDHPPESTVKEKLTLISSAVLDGDISPVEGKAVSDMLLSEYNFLELERISAENRTLVAELKKSRR